MKDQNYVVKVEKAISEKWGSEAIQNPKANWDKEKEKEYLEELKRLEEKKNFDSEHEIEKNGFLIKSNLINKKKDKRECEACGIFSFDNKDNLYLSKFGTCWKCWIQWVEGREERWKKGWRPNK